MLSSVLVANRGEIACRIIRGARDLGVRSVAVYSEADARAPFVALADEAYCIGPPQPQQSYLNIDAILDVAKKSGVEAIHPGYGFLSENAKFSAACRDAGITFIGPTPEAIESMGDKVSARERMRVAGVPIVPGSGFLTSVEEAQSVAETVGYPILLKASAGGGGIGMHVATTPEELSRLFETAQSQALRAFGNGALFLERYVAEPRHIEIQIIADTHGNVVHLGERECSIQRRHQKIIEETPSVVITDELREQMGAAAVKAGAAVGYVNAGTVEFIFSRGEFFFLEMNTRLQVEHPITEAVTGIDLVETQFRVASGEKLPFTQKDIHRTGHAIECRINAEAYAQGFLPSPGTVRGYHAPEGPGVRVDSALAGPGTVSPHYDPMVAKLIVWGSNREQAIHRMERALYEYVVTGMTTNIPYHAAVMQNEEFRKGNYTTAFIEEHPELVAIANTWDASRNVQDLVDDPRKRAAVIAAVAAVQRG